MGFQIYDSSGRLKTVSEQVVDANLLTHPGFREDEADDDGHYVGFSHGGNDSGTSHTAIIKYQPWYFPYDVTVVSMCMNGDDAGNTGVLKVGLYENSKGLPTTLISASSTSMTGAGTANTVSSVSFKIDAGWYWMGSVVTSGTVDIEHSYSATRSKLNYYSASPSYYGSDWGCYTEAGSDLPTEASAAGSAADYSNQIPRIGLRMIQR